MRCGHLFEPNISLHSVACPPVCLTWPIIFGGRGGGLHRSQDAISPPPPLFSGVAVPAAFPGISLGLSSLRVTTGYHIVVWGNRSIEHLCSVIPRNLSSASW